MSNDNLPAGVYFHSLGEGKLGPIFRATDWSKTPLGPLEAWPQTLKGYVNMILTLPTPAIIFWGENQIQIYNDGYSEIMGPRHPTYFGKTYRECWPDTYPTIYPWMQRVLKNAEVVKVDRTLIPLTRYGFNEEAYFSFSFSPLKDDYGKIAGILQLVTEMTETVLAERRLKTLRSLAPTTEIQLKVVQNIKQALSDNPDDIRFALLFTTDEPEKEPGLILSSGIDDSISTDSVPTYLNKIVNEVYNSRCPIEITDIQNLLPRKAVFALHEPANLAFALPIQRTKTDASRGVIILGVSPRLRFDDKYREFFHAIARTIASGIEFKQKSENQYMI